MSRTGPADDVQAIADGLGVELLAAANASGRSGATVWPGRDRAGRPVVLKVGRHTDETLRQAMARELAVYADWAPAHRIDTAQLLASSVTEAQTALVLSRHRPSPPAHRWPPDLWDALMGALVRLHEAPPPTSSQATGDGSGWDRAAEPGLDLTGADRRLIDRLWSSPDDRARVRWVEYSLPDLRAAVAASDRTFTHGDTHTENVVLDRDRVLLVDWQSARTGRSCADLAFALTRAIPTGARPPRDQVIARYAHDRGLDLQLTHRAVSAAQILTLVEHYPRYAGYLTTAQAGRLRRSLPELVASFAAG